MIEMGEKNEQALSCRRVMVRVEIAREHKCEVVRQECVCQIREYFCCIIFSRGNV